MDESRFCDSIGLFWITNDENPKTIGSFLCQLSHSRKLWGRHQRESCIKRLINKRSTSARKAKNRCFEYLKSHQDGLLLLSARELLYKSLPGLGCMESNAGKASALISTF
jgi:hypothetical protein